MELEQESHLDRVPELAALAPVVLDAPAFLDEPELAVEGDAGGVVWEDAEAQLVRTLPPRPLDRRGHQGGADAAAAPLAQERHPDLAVPMPGGSDVDRADHLAVGNRDERALERPVRGARLDVDRRL